MKRTALLFVLTLAFTAGASAQSWATRWDWPLVPVHQQYNVGESAASDMDVGGAGIYWDLLKQADSPFVRKSAADSTPAAVPAAKAQASAEPKTPATKS